MHKGYLVTAAFLGALSVALGAFGAHLLKEWLSPQSLNTFETAVRYQFYHVFALAVVGILYKSWPGSLLRYAGLLFILGILLFSGSLYLLTVFSVTGQTGFRWIGAITPLGGASFMAGWLCIAYAILKRLPEQSGKL
ncbi:MAG: hypothetical protein JWQ78_1755 [Sediminibacterium sp.]|nr:hypothetical protein [Sediminibacterium sp.]